MLAADPVREPRETAFKRSASPSAFQTSARAHVLIPPLPIAKATIGAVTAVRASPVEAGLTKLAGRGPFRRPITKAKPIRCEILIPMSILPDSTVLGHLPVIKGLGL